MLLDRPVVDKSALLWNKGYVSKYGLDKPTNEKLLEEYKDLDIILALNRKKRKFTI